MASDRVTQTASRDGDTRWRYHCPLCLHCFFAVASADPNSHKDAGGWRMASLSFLSLELIVIVVRMFAILCIKTLDRRLRSFFG